QISRNDASIQGRVSRVSISKQGLDIQGLELSGAGGQLSASLTVKRDRILMNAHGEDVDLDILSRVFGLSRGTLSGKLNVSTDVNAQDDKQQGSIHLAMGDGNVGPFLHVSVRLDAELEGEKFTGQASALARDVGALGTIWDTEITGPVSHLESWKKLL